MSPFVEIVKQPQSRIRFRYKTEGSTAGALLARSSDNKENSFPTIKVHNYEGPFTVVVSCVSKQKPYKVHPHQLVSSKNCDRGIYVTQVTRSSVVSFPNLGIQHTKKLDIQTSLERRKDLNVDPFQAGFSHKENIKEIDLKAVRLCFQVFLQGKDGQPKPLTPVVSEPVIDSKSGNDLKICKLSKDTSSVKGGEEIVLLCEKVNKDDLEIHIYEEDEAGNLIWEDFGDITMVHHQVAVVFKTPSYRKGKSPGNWNVHIELRRPSDSAVSESLPFQYITEPDDYVVPRKKKKASTEHAKKLQQGSLTPLLNEETKPVLKREGSSPDTTKIIQVPVPLKTEIPKPEYSVTENLALPLVYAADTTSEIPPNHQTQVLDLDNQEFRGKTNNDQLSVQLLNISEENVAQLSNIDTGTTETSSMVRVMDANEKTIAVFPNTSEGMKNYAVFMQQADLNVQQMFNVNMESQSTEAAINNMISTGNTLSTPTTIALNQIDSVLASTASSNSNIQLFYAMPASTS